MIRCGSIPTKTLKPLRSIDNLDSGKKHLIVLPPPPQKKEMERLRVGWGRGEEVRIAAKQ